MISYLLYLKINQEKLKKFKILILNSYKNINIIIKIKIVF